MTDKPHPPVSPDFAAMARELIEEIEAIPRLRDGGAFAKPERLRLVIAKLTLARAVGLEDAARVAARQTICCAVSVAGGTLTDDDIEETHNDLRDHIVAAIRALASDPVAGDQVAEDAETPCTNRDDKTHCNCWYDGGACCACSATPAPAQEVERLARAYEPELWAETDQTIASYGWCPTLTRLFREASLKRAEAAIAALAPRPAPKKTNETR